VVESLVLYLVNAPSLILASFFCAKPCGLRAPVGRTAAARPVKRAGSRPGNQRTAHAHSPRGLEHQCQLAAQTVIKRLSKFNRCHLSHIREDTGQHSVPVQEFLLLWHTHLPCLVLELNIGRPLCTTVSGLTH